MEKGEAFAAVLNPPWGARAEESGHAPDGAPLRRSYPAIRAASSRSAVRGARRIGEEVAAFLRGLRDAMRWARSPERRGAAAALAASEMSVGQEQAARALARLPETLRLDPAAFAIPLEIRLRFRLRAAERNRDSGLSRRFVFGRGGGRVRRGGLRRLLTRPSRSRMAPAARRRRPGQVGIVVAEVRDDLLGAEDRVVLLGLDDHRDEVGACGAGVVVGSVREVVEAGVAEAFVAVDELAGGLAGDAEAPREVGDGVVASEVSGDEGAALVLGLWR